MGSFAVNERAELWRASSWIVAQVIAVYPSGGSATVDGRQVRMPPGSVVVSFDGGHTKCIAPDQVDKFLRKGPFHQGDRVQVWSNGQEQWLDAVIRSVSEVDSARHGYTVPAGTLEVEYVSSGAFKYVYPHERGRLLRAVGGSHPSASPRGAQRERRGSRCDGTGSSHAGAPGAAAQLASQIAYPTHRGRSALDDYEQLREVDRGAFASVCVVRQRRSGQLWALKTISLANSEREMLASLTRGEVKILKLLNHPNILRVHEVYEDDSRIQVVVDLCVGGTLAQRIRFHYRQLHRPIEEGHAAFMARQLLSATEYFHSKGVVHRDVKPENILFVDVSSSSPLKVIDFGLAVELETLQRQARAGKIEVAGTKHYMAPEIHRGGSEPYDQKVDLFSIGIVMCEILTGQHPYYAPADDKDAIALKICSPATLSGAAWARVSPSAVDLCHQLLERAPGRRPAAARALDHAWFQDPSKPSPFGDMSLLTRSMFEDLGRFQAHPKFKRAVLQVLSRDVSEFQLRGGRVQQQEAVAELRNKFMALDVRGSGFLSRQEVLNGMREVACTHTLAPDAIVGALGDGTSSDDKIGYEEFMAALMETRVPASEEQLRQCFRKFDVEGTGRIRYVDVERATRAAISRQEWRDLIGDHGGDAAHDYGITFETFADIYARAQ